MPFTTIDDYYKWLATGQALDPSEGMKFEAIRIGTYSEWPESSNARPIWLSKAGFYRSGQRGTDQVTCFSCKISISSWEPNDIPIDEHRKMSPNCIFLNPGNRDSSDPQVNIPMKFVENLSLKGALAQLKGEQFNTEEAGNIAIEAERQEEDPDSGNTSDEDEEEEEEEEGYDNQEQVRENDIGRGSGALSLHAPAVQASVPIARPQAPPQTYVPLQPQGTPTQATASAFPKQGMVSDGPQGPGQAEIQNIINKIPPTHRVSQPNPQPDSTDPRKRADFGFLDRMRSEKERRSTFYDFPERAWQTPDSLAAAGFFYTGTSDRTQCAFCRGILRNWEPNDTPMQEHKRHFGECPFVNGRNVGNVPTKSNRGANQAEGSSRSTGRSPASKHVARAPQRDSANVTNSGLGITTQRPKNPEYAIEATRVKTFDHPEWPNTRVQSPELLAKAGFFYAGFADNVKCFYCDGGLRNWEPEDEPWEEHAHWFPRCPFVRMTKGDAFIQEIQQNKALPQRQSERSATESAQGETQAPSSNNAASSVTYRIEPKEVKARMDTPTVKTAIDMGYHRDIVRKVIDERLRTTGDDFENASDLLEAIFNMEEKMNKQKKLEDNIRQRATSSTQGACALEANAAPTRPEASFAKDEVVGADAMPSDSSQQSKKKKKKRNRNKNKGSAANQGGTVAANQATTAVTTDKNQKEQRVDVNGEYEVLIQENEEMKEQRICKVCMDNDVNVVFLPCAHLVCCTNCAPALRNCPICRQLIKGTVRIFLS